MGRDGGGGEGDQPDQLVANFFLWSLTFGGPKRLLGWFGAKVPKSVDMTEGIWGFRSNAKIDLALFIKGLL